ncbi:hypothetical protein PS6_007948 [Mucor atramentarius]
MHHQWSLGHLHLLLWKNQQKCYSTFCEQHHRRKLKATAPKAANSPNNRACIVNFPGNTTIPKDFAWKLKAPDFIASLEARQWKQEASLVKSYFQHTDTPEDTPNQMMTVLNGTFHKIIKAKNADVKLKAYGAKTLVVPKIVIGTQRTIKERHQNSMKKRDMNWSVSCFYVAIDKARHRCLITSLPSM